MAGRRVQRIRSVSSMSVVQVEDEATARALDQVGDAVQKLQATRQRDVKTVDLIVGQNRVRHGLGRPAVGYTITPTVADATYADALDVTNPHPELEVWITVVGVAQPDARVEMF